MQISITAFIAPKESELFYDCADRYAFDKSQNKFAISDGVSKSFFPKIWADILVNKWVASKEFDETSFILDCQKKWWEQVTEIVNKPTTKWFTKNAFNRKESGLATFVGLRFYKKKKEWFWKGNALGDSFMFFIPNKYKVFSKECIVLSSKQEPIIFDNYPDYLSSMGNNHKGEKQVKEKLLSPGTFYLMTDALAEWFLNEKDDAISKISVWQNQKDFERFINEERIIGKLGNDDSAILIIKTEEDSKENLTYVSEKSSDIDELIEIEQKEIEQKEIEFIEKEKELSIQKEQETNIENEYPKEIVIEKTKMGLLEKSKEWVFGKKEIQQPIERKEIETEVVGENQKEKEPLKKGEENNTEIKKTEENQNHESEIKSNKKSITTNKPSQNITDKF